MKWKRWQRTQRRTGQNIMYMRKRNTHIKMKETENWDRENSSYPLHQGSPSRAPRIISVFSVAGRMWYTYSQAYPLPRLWDWCPYLLSTILLGGPEVPIPAPRFHRYPRITDVKSSVRGHTPKLSLELKFKLEDDDTWSAPPRSVLKTDNDIVRVILFFTKHVITIISLCFKGK